MKARALVHDVYVKCDMNAMLRLGAIAKSNSIDLTEVNAPKRHGCYTGASRVTRGEEIKTIQA